MGIWIIPQPLGDKQEEDILQSDVIRLPFDGMPDLSHVKSAGHVRDILQKLEPGSPPESISLNMDRLWKKFGGITLDDLIVVPVAQGKKIAIAHVGGAYSYEVGAGGEDEHYIAVKWYEKLYPANKLGKYGALLKYDYPYMEEVDDKDARQKIQSILPHGYNRFVKFKWLAAIFIVLAALRFVGRF